MGRVTIPCSSNGCKHETDTWYSCCKDCEYVVGFCKDCGGLSRAERTMKTHKVGCVPTYGNSKPVLVQGVPDVPSCDGNPYAHADILDEGGECKACGFSVQKITEPSRLMDVSLCEVCRKPVQGAGRRCCPGIGECFQELHKRDQEKRLKDALDVLKKKYAYVPEMAMDPDASIDRVIEQLNSIIETVFEAGRKF